MEKFKQIFKKTPAIIGMIHVRPLPGTPLYEPGSFHKVISKAEKEAEILLNVGIDGLLIENMHDVPYVKRRIGPEITSSMAVIGQKVKSLAGNTPCGVQILSGCNKEALSVAKAANLQFIRAEGFVFAHVADEGIVQSDAGQLLRYRKSIDADDVMIFTDVKKKHSSHSITEDVSLSETCHAAEMFMSDGLIITGSSTGHSASPQDLNISLKASSLPVIIGSGVRADNLLEYTLAHGIIIGSHFKKYGLWRNELCQQRLKTFTSILRSVRET